LRDQGELSPALVRKLLILYFEGQLHATITHHGPLCAAHASACASGLCELALVGFMTDNGQERQEQERADADEYIQHAYLSGSFCVRKDDARWQDVVDMLRSTGLNFCASRGHSQAALGLCGDHVIQQSGVHAQQLLNMHEGTLVDTGAFWVTYRVDGGEYFTNVYVDNDPYMLRAKGVEVVDFVVWESEATAQDKDLQSSLLDAARRSPQCVVV
jgi:hypothetical protein